MIFAECNGYHGATCMSP